MEHKKAGRPRKASSLLKSHRVTILLDDEEYALLNDLKQKTRSKTYSNALKDAMRNRPMPTAVLDYSDLELFTELKSYCRELNKIGVNVNQTVKKINALDSTAVRAMTYEVNKLLNTVIQCQNNVREVEQLAIKLAKIHLNP